MGCVQAKNSLNKQFSQQEKSNFSRQFDGKNFFITGGTGFFGKCFIEKLLRSYHTLNGIYVLVRPKNDLSAEQNFQKNLIQTPLIQNLSQSLQDKIHYIEGDISQENLNLSLFCLNFIKKNIHYIIHAAASLDFTQPLIQNAIQNIRPTLQLYEIAKESNVLENFVFISSTYSQSHKSGFIKEKIYNLFDNNKDIYKEYESVYTYILNNNLSQNEEEELIGQSPNSYTFTKNMCERILERRKKEDKNTTVTIFRPSVLISATQEPIPGYIDQLTGVGIVHYYIGTGQLKHFYVNRENIADLIPCDVSVCQLIMALGILANTRQLSVINSGTGHQYPVKNGLHLDICKQFWTDNKTIKTTAPPSCEFNSNFDKIKRKHQDMKRKANRIDDQKIKLKCLEMVDRSLMLNLVYKNINSHEMIFESKLIYKIAKYLGEEDQKILANWDVKKINWEQTITMHQYGLQKFILKENIKMPLFQKNETQEKTRSSISTVN